MKLVIDMNLSPEWTVVLQQHGWEAIHWSSIGDPRATDSVILEWARQNGCAVFTHDLDFAALLAATQAHGPSVIQVRTQDVTPAYLSGFVLEALRQYQPLLEAGALITVDERKSRARILPIRG